MCSLIGGTSYLAPGWLCCACKVYNGLRRSECKICARRQCTALSGGASGPIPNPTPTQIVSPSDAEEISQLLATIGEAAEKILLRVEGMSTLQGLSLVEVLQAFLASGVMEASASTFQRIPEIVARLPVAQEAQALGLSMVSSIGAASPLKH